jgi:hypothetical protein
MGASVRIETGLEGLDLWDESAVWARMDPVLRRLLGRYGVVKRMGNKWAAFERGEWWRLECVELECLKEGGFVARKLNEYGQALGSFEGPTPIQALRGLTWPKQKQGFQRTPEVGRRQSLRKNC